MTAALLCLALLSASYAQDWRPPSIAAPRAAVRYPDGTQPVAPAILGAALPRLGPEGERAAAWARGREDLWLRRDGDTWTLGSGADSTPLSSELGARLENARRYFALTDATLANPISPAEFDAGLLSPAGAARVQALYEAMIRDGIRAQGKTLFLERGGEATLDGAVDLHEWPEPTRDSMARLAGAIDDEAELSRLSASDDGVRDLDNYGLLRSLVSLLPRLHARGDAPESVAKLRRQTVMTLLENGAAAFVFDPDSQLAAVVAQDWDGRYVGKWHLHPPHWTSTGWAGSDGPSAPDMDIALRSGQNLTISFQPDGFDAYDLSPLAAAGRADLTLARVIRYRSDAWRRRFAALRP